MSYDPKSNDAMFSRIEQKLEELLTRSQRIEEQTTKTNGRVSRLENWQTDIRARIAIIALVVSGCGTVAMLVLNRLWGK